MRGPFGFDVVPQFWTFLSKQVEAGNIKAPKMVYDEILTGKDELAKWIRPRGKHGFNVAANGTVRKHFQSIAVHVTNKYSPPQAGKFLADGDPWVIAHAMENDGVAVTHETERGNLWKIKIPIICKEFDVRCINTYEMNKELKFTTASGHHA
jgi:hypothetical protein